MQYIVKKKGYRVFPIIVLALLALGLTVAFALPNPLGALNDPKFEFDGNILTDAGTADGTLDWDDTQAAVVNCLPTTVGPPCEPNDNLDGEGVIEACRVLPAGTIIPPNTEQISCATDGVAQTVPPTPNGGCIQTNGPAVAGTSDAGTPGAGITGAGLLICDGSVGNDATASGGSTDLNVFATGSHNEAADWQIQQGSSSPKKTDFSDLSVYAKFMDSVFDDDDGDCGVALDNTPPTFVPPLTDACRNDADEDFDDVAIFAGATRLDVQGSTHMDVELTRKDLTLTTAEGGTCTETPTVLLCPTPLQRTPGDVLIAIDLSGGGAVVTQRIFIQKCLEVTETPGPQVEDCPDAFDLAPGDPPTPTGEVCANDPQVAPPCLVDVTPAGSVPIEAAQGVLSTSEIQGPHWDAVGCDRTSGDNTNGCKIRDDIVAGGFMETFTDLSFFGIEADCPGFGNVFFKSRASDGINSSLQDVAEGRINITRCGSIIVKKTDDLGNLLPGAGFTFDPNPFDGGAAIEIDDGGPEDAANGDDGILCIDAVLFDTYDITETQVPSGYKGDPDAEQVQVTDAATCAERLPDPYVADDVTGEDALFTNILGTLEWEKRDDVGNLLGGASFTISPNPFSCHVGDGTAPGTIADDTDGTTLATDVDKDPQAGQFKLARVCLGSYTVTESAAPSGYAKDTDDTRVETVSDDTNLVDDDGDGTVDDAEEFNAVIGTSPLGAPPGVDDKAGTEPCQASLATGGNECDFHNRLGTIEWEKRDDLGNLQGGASFTIAPNPFSCHVGDGTAPGTIADDTDGTSNGETDRDPDPGQFKLVRVCLGSYTITESSAPNGFATDSDTTRSATVSATDLNAVIGVQGADDKAGTEPCQASLATGGNECDFHNRLGSITIEKKDKLTNALVLVAGAEFDVTPSPWYCHGGTRDGTGTPTANPTGTLHVVDNGANDENATTGVVGIGRACLFGAATAGAAAETPVQCQNNVNDDVADDTVINDGCGYTVTETLPPPNFQLPSPASQGPTPLVSAASITFTFSDLPLLRLFSCVERMDSVAAGCQPLAGVTFTLSDIPGGSACTFSGTPEQVQTAVASGEWTNLLLNCELDGDDAGTNPDPGYDLDIGTIDP